MKGVEGLKAFCDDLASDEPAPGGGTAAAAAGAMAASLLSMVCGVTLKSRKHEANWPKLTVLRGKVDSLAGMLLRCAEEDAKAYEMVVAFGRVMRERPGDAKAASAYADAVKLAMHVPTSTAELCVEVLRQAREVAAVGTKSASSDIEVARLLAAAGADGAVANIMVNTPYCDDRASVAQAKEKAEALRREKADLLQG